MKRNTLLSAAVLIVVLLCGGCSGGPSRGPNVGSGTEGSSTNDLSSSANVNLFLDQMTFNGNIKSIVLDGGHPHLELHIMNSAGQLIGCAGFEQNPVMNYLGYSTLTYAHINTQFVFESGQMPASTDALTVRIINKNPNSGHCPSHFVGGSSDVYDLIVSETTTTLGSLLSNGVTFPNTAVAYFRHEADAPRGVSAAANTDRGQLAVDQMNITSFDMGTGEISDPEVELVLAEYGILSLLACADLSDIDTGSLLYGTMAYGFVKTSGGARLALADIDPTKHYWFLLLERDTGGSCSASIVGRTILARTGTLDQGNFLTAPVEFEQNFGNFVLYTKVAN